MKGAPQYLDNGRLVGSQTALIDVNLAPGNAVIRNCVLDGGRRGIRLYGARNGGLVSTVVAEGNVMRNMGGTLGFGFEVQNAGTAASDPIPASGTTWNVTLRDNVLERNRIGLAAFNENPGADGNNVSLLSVHNVYRDNQAGITLQPGLFGVHDNVEHFVSIDDAILDNVGAPVLGLGGGILAIGGRITAPGATNEDNQLRVQLIGTRFAGNLQGTARRDVTVYGALGIGSTLAGTGNRVVVLARRATSDGAAGAFVFADSVPADAGGSNSVRIVGSATVFERTNEGLELGE